MLPWHIVFNLIDKKRKDCKYFYTMISVDSCFTRLGIRLRLTGTDVLSTRGRNQKVRQSRQEVERQ